MRARPAATPIRDAGEFRIRHDRVDQTINDRNVRVLTRDGELITQHQIDPTRTYQPHT